MSAKAYQYIRFSSEPQEQGDSIRRQTDAGKAWSKRKEIPIARVFMDKGISGFSGAHRQEGTDLAELLGMIQSGRIPSGDFLLCENLDRLSREKPTQALLLILGIIDKGIKLVALSPVETEYTTEADMAPLMGMVMEVMRGHGESKRKSSLSGPAWRRKKDGARNGGIVTERLPAWVTIKEGKLALIPERAKTVRTIFKLAANGYGVPSIVKKLTADKVPPIGKTGKWVKGYLGKILRDRRAIGEYQPRKGKKREPDGEPVKGYFPAVVSEDEFYQARAGAAERGTLRGRTGIQRINLFAGLMKNARENDAYYMTMRVQKEGRYQVLINHNSDQGLSPCWSFPYEAFEKGILDSLREIEPDDIEEREDGSELADLTADLVAVEGRLAGMLNELLEGDSPTIGKAVKVLEAKQADLRQKLEAAKAAASKPLADSWEETRSLLGMLAKAKDKNDARLRLRSALRRIVESMTLLVVPRKLVRLAAVQIHFKEAKHPRFVFMLFRPPHSGFGGRKEGLAWVRAGRDSHVWRRSCPAGLSEWAKGRIDLRERKDTMKLLAAMDALDVKALEFDAMADTADKESATGE